MNERQKLLHEACLHLMEEQIKSGLSPEEFYNIIEEAIKLNKADIINS